MTAASAFFSEFLGSAMLLFGILVMTDKKNAVPSWFVPVGLFITLFGIGAGMGFETGILLISCSMIGTYARKQVSRSTLLATSAQEHLLQWSVMVVRYSLQKS